MAGRSSALSAPARSAADPRAIRRELIGRGFVALVWAVADIGQVALAWTDGTGDRAGDEPFVVFVVSSLVGAVLLCGLAVVNFAGARAQFDPARLTRLATPARVVAWLFALRLVAGIGLMVATRGASGARDQIPQLTFGTLMLLAFFDGVVALAIAAWTAIGLNRIAQLALPTATDWH